MTQKMQVVISTRSYGKTESSGADLLRQAGLELVYLPDRHQPGAPAEEELAELLSREETVALLSGTVPVTEAMIANAPSLKVISMYGVSTGHIAVEAARQRGIVVEALPPGSNAEAVADMTWGLILAVARRIPRADALVRSGRWQTLGGVSVYDKTLGILGFGAIGQAVARRAAGFRMRVLAGNHNPEKYQEAAESLGVQLVALETLLAEADILTIHVPLTQETRGMIGHDQLRMMKQGAILVNTSRGAVVDEKALCCALQEGWIGGAGLDVFEKEPLPEDSCLRFASNCVLTPHIAARAVESDRFVGIYAARVVLDALGLG